MIFSICCGWWEKFESLFDVSVCLALGLVLPFTRLTGYGFTHYTLQEKREELWTHNRRNREADRPILRIKFCTENRTFHLWGGNGFKSKYGRPKLYPCLKILLRIGLEIEGEWGRDQEVRGGCKTRKNVDKNGITKPTLVHGRGAEFLPESSISIVLVFIFAHLSG